MFISPAVAGDLVFVGSCSGRFFALDRRTGTAAWVYDTSQDGPAAQFHGEVLVTDDLVVVGSDARPTGYLYAFERRTGDVRWKQPFVGGVAADVRRAGDTLLAVSMSAEVVALDLKTGAVRWRRDDPPPRAPGTRTLDAALDDGRLFVPWRPGVVDAFDAATGDRLWRRDLGAELNTSAVLSGEELLVGAVDGRLFRLRPSDGEVLGSYDVGGMPYGDLEVAGGCLLSLWAEGQGDATGRFGGPHVVACLEGGLGRERWRLELATEWGTFHPLIRDGQVILGSEGVLLGVDLADGSLVWQRSIPGLPRGLGGSEGILYVGTLGGSVFALPWEERSAPGR